MKSEYTFAILTACADAGMPLSKHDLVVRAWKRSTKLFGLAGYEKMHPDSNKVWCYLYGKRGLVASGLLAKVGERFVLTDDGRAWCGRVVVAEMVKVAATPHCKKCRCADVEQVAENRMRCTNCGETWKVAVEG